MKGDVKRHFSPADWKTNVLSTSSPALLSAVIRRASLFPFVFIRASPASFPDLRLCKQDAVVVATGWFYRRLDAYGFFRLSEGA